MFFYYFSTVTILQYGQAEDYGVKIVNPLTVTNLPEEDIPVSLHPNLASQFIIVQCPALCTPIVLDIINMLGQRVAHYDIRKTGNSLNEVIDLSNFSRGTYLLRVSNQQTNQVLRFTCDN